MEHKDIPTVSSPTMNTSLLSLLGRRTQVGQNNANVPSEEESQALNTSNRSTTFSPLDRAHLLSVIQQALDLTADFDDDTDNDEEEDCFDFWDNLDRQKPSQ